MRSQNDGDNSIVDRNVVSERNKGQRASTEANKSSPSSWLVSHLKNATCRLRLRGFGVQEVPGSNPGSPTNPFKELQARYLELDSPDFVL
jgi:hypothetical protein